MPSDLRQDPFTRSRTYLKIGCAARGKIPSPASSPSQFVSVCFHVFLLFVALDIFSGFAVLDRDSAESNARRAVYKTTPRRALRGSPRGAR